MARNGRINPEVFGPWGFRSSDAHPERTEHLIHIPSKFGSFYIGLYTYYATKVEAITFMRAVNRMLVEIRSISPTRTAAIEARITTLTERAEALLERDIPTGSKIVVYVQTAALERIITEAQQWRDQGESEQGLQQ